MDKDYLQMSLQTFNTDKPNWYGWKTHDDNGDLIPNNQRMTYANIKIIKEGATIPSEANVNAKIQEIKDADTLKANAKTTGKDKLKSSDALTDAEISALFGDT
jgi:hypothetical protein